MNMPAKLPVKPPPRVEHVDDDLMQRAIDAQPLKVWDPVAKKMVPWKPK